MRLYILGPDGRTPVKAASTLEWGRWFEVNRETRVVAAWTDNGVTVSTVFLGSDHQWLPGGKPLLFETMIFGGPDDQDTWRYSTWDEAEAGHMKRCKEQRAKAQQ